MVYALARIQNAEFRKQFLMNCFLVRELLVVRIQISIFCFLYSKIISNVVF